MIDLNPSQATRAKAVETIAEAIDLGLARARDSQAPRAYLGASSIGDECSRRIQLDFIRANELPGAPESSGEGFGPLTLRIFGMGHVLEDLAIVWLKQAGFDIRTRKADGRQFGFSVADGQFSGHCDGVIVSGPADIAYPALWEHKGTGRKSWQDIAKKGVAVARPTYAAQIALYQAYLELDAPALFQATNRDTAEIYFELVPFDPQLAQRTSDRAVEILQATKAGELMPRGFAAADHYQCKSCRWAEFCWGAPK